MNGSVLSTRKGFCYLLYGMSLFLGAIFPVMAAAQPSLQMLTGTGTTETSLEGETQETAHSYEEQLQIAESRIADIEKNISENLIQEESGQEVVQGIPLIKIQERTAALRAQLMANQRQRNALRDLIEFEKQQATFEAERDSAAAIQEEPPYTMAFLDGLLDAVTVRQMDVEAEALSLRALRELVSMEYADIAAAKTVQNRAGEALRTASQENRAVLLYDVETARLRVETSESEHEAAKLELARTQTHIELLEAQLRLAQDRVLAARKQTLFRQEELDAIIQKQEETIAALTKEAQDVRNAIERHRTRIASSERSLERATEAAVQQQAREEVELNRKSMEASRIHLAILESLQEYETDIINLWRMRFWVANPALSPERPDWNEWDSKLRERIEVFRKERSAGDSRAMSLRSQITALETRLANWKPEEGEKRRVEQELSILRDRENVRTRIQTRMAQIENLADRILAEVVARQKERDWTERINDVARHIYNWISLAFDRELAEIGGESITGRKLFYMVTILVVGFVFGHMFIRYLRRYALEKMKLRSNVVLIIEKLSNYLLFIIVVYFALNYVGIPLTIFTFLGGAIALGIGFGAQNLINNFLCGLILMGEQPIRLGDWVEIDGRLGTISNIGARASRLHLFSGVDVLIPNSKFLENNVINWTLSDSQIRLRVAVGVAYGSPTREVARLIMRAITEHGLVLDTPEPKVIFEEFGENALQFAAYFWIEISPNIDSRIVTSDIRHRIDKLFREAGIVIAYPQRDIHLDTIMPLEVRMVNDGNASEEEQKEEATPRKLPG